MEVREEHRLGVNVHARELSTQICAGLLPIGYAVDPIEQSHRFGVAAIRRMFRERVVKARVDQEVSEFGMVYPVNKHTEIARPMMTVRLPGALGVEVETSVHVDNTGLNG